MSLQENLNALEIRALKLSEQARVLSEDILTLAGSIQAFRRLVAEPTEKLPEGFCYARDLKTGERFVYEGLTYERGDKEQDSHLQCWRGPKSDKWVRPDLIVQRVS
jgi:hypothetical protein